MIVRDDLERQLVDWLVEVATPHDVELRDVFARTREMHQRPGWTSPASRLAAQLSSLWAGMPRAVPALTLVALLVIALVAALIVGAQHRVPPPFGPARAGLVAFESDGDIYVVRPDGSGRRLLIGGPEVQFAPTWAPDGTRISYWSGPDPRYPASLWIANQDGTGATKVTGDVAFYMDDPVQWSPDGRLIAFATRTGEIGTLAADGGAMQRIGDPALRFSRPSWSSDGSWIAVRGYGPTADQTTYRGFVIRPDGSGQTQIAAPTFNDLAHMGYAWSPDGRAVLHHAGLTDDVDIAVSRDGAGGVWHEEVLVGGPTRDVLPVWSNDGRRFAFIRTDGYGTAKQVNRVMLADADGTGIRPVSDQPVEQYEPCWAPDDSAIQALSYSKVDLSGTVDLIAVDGSGVVEIGAPDGVSAECAWQRLAP